MSKRIIRITESDITKIVKKVLLEQGGYDDVDIMGAHAGNIYGRLNFAVESIIEILESTAKAFQDDIPKENMMMGIIKVSDILDEIETKLRSISPEIILNKDLKRATMGLFKELEKGKNKLRYLADRSNIMRKPGTPPAMTGIGYSMGRRDLNDKIIYILFAIGEEAQKLAFQLNDEHKNMLRRISKHF